MVRKGILLFERTFNISQNWAMALIIYIGLIAAFAVAGAYLGLFLARMNILDIEEAVTNYQQDVTTRILDGSGKDTLRELAQERRVLIGYDQIPKSFIHALIAIEDKEFLNHHGVDLFGIARAFWVNFTSGRVVQGGSTISQQLIKNLFLSSEQTYTRKIKEAILALQLEAKYTKEEILSFYCNTIYFGHQRYGLEAAARFYFNKRAADLTLAESALLAGILRAPEYYTPLRYPERALARRNLVLDRMVAVDMLDAAKAKETKALPLGLHDSKSNERIGQYFLEEVRRFLVQKYGKQKTLGGGLKVYTTLDLRMQTAAEDALRKGLYELSMRQPMGPVQENILEQEKSLESYIDPDWAKPMAEGEFVHALVTEVSRQKATIRIGKSELAIGSNDFPIKMLTAQQRTQLDKVLRPGDLIPVRIDKLIEHKGPEKAETSDEQAENADAAQPDEEISYEVKEVTVTQKPKSSAALVAIEAQTGKVLALVGGFTFSDSQWDRAIQAKRQTGSAFKPIVASAAFEENKATLGSTIFDEPTDFNDPGAPELYQPDNYKKSYIGITTVRDLIEQSRNIPAIKLMLHTGLDKTIAVAKKMGVKQNLPAIFSLALGSIEMSLIEMVGVYSVFPNQGVRVEPYFISRVEDYTGELLYEQLNHPSTAIRRSSAFLVTQALLGVIERGTGKSAKHLVSKYEVPLGGKTGTTDDYTDAWFVGFSPQIVCGVWVGNDDKVTLGNDESGARAALPIWIRFMDKALEDEKWRKVKRYEIPPNILAVEVDHRNGLLASRFTPVGDRLLEFFIRGTEPTRATTYDDDYNLRISPYRLMEKRVTITFDGDDRVRPRDLYGSIR